MLFMGRMPFLLTCLICAGVLCIALVMEYGFGVLGCTLCKYERLFILAGGLVAFGGLLVPQIFRGAGFLVLSLIFIVGFSLALYHVFIQQGILPLPSFCKPPSIPQNLSLDELRTQLLATPFVPCNKVTWSLFGLSLAVYNALLCGCLALYNLIAYKRGR